MNRFLAMFRRPESKPAASSRGPAFRPTFDVLEGRCLMATGLSTAPALLVPLPSVPPAAQSVDLLTTPRQVLSGLIVPTASLRYEVFLRQGERLAIDVDPRSQGPAIPGLTASTLTITSAAGAPLAQVGGSKEPDSGALTGNPAHLFTAPTAGNYVLQLTSTTPQLRGFSLELHRLGLAEGQQNPAALQGSGSLYAFLNGNNLHITGPTGYGFAIRGNWSQSVVPAGGALKKSTYSASGTVYLQSAVGEVPLPAPQGLVFTVTTTANLWGDVFGPLGTFQANATLPLGPFADKLKDKFGLNLSSVTFDKLSVQLGRQVKQERGIEQVLNAVPYLVYGDKPAFQLQFGTATLTTTKGRDSSLFLTDPADPFVYVKSGDYAFAGSLHGMIPYRPNFTPATPLPALYGHVHARGNFPLGTLPLAIDGAVTLDLDANRDGLWMAGQGNANQLFKGGALSSAALDAVFRDIKLGLNGKLTFGYTKAGFNFSVPVAAASLVYQGPAQSAWFKGGTVNPWQGTPLNPFLMTQTDTLEGSVNAAGAFSLTAHTTYRLFGGKADVILTLDNSGVTAVGKVRALGAQVSLTGKVHANGNFSLAGKANVAFSGFSGTASFLLSQAGGKVSFTATADGKARWSQTVLGTKWTAEARVVAQLTMTYSASGTLIYSGTATAQGQVTSPLGSKKFSVTAKVSNNKLVFTLPVIGAQGITLPAV